MLILRSQPAAMMVEFAHAKAYGEQECRAMGPWIITNTFRGSSMYPYLAIVYS